MNCYDITFYNMNDFRSVYSHINDYLVYMFCDFDKRKIIFTSLSLLFDIMDFCEVHHICFTLIYEVFDDVK